MKRKKLSRLELLFTGILYTLMYATIYIGNGLIQGVKRKYYDLEEIPYRYIEDDPISYYERLN